MILLFFFYLIDIISASQLSNLRSLLNAEEIHRPMLNFSSSRNNEIQLLGSIETFNYYDYQGQQNFTTASSSQNELELIYYSNNTLLRLDAVPTDVEMRHIIPFMDDCFILSGIGTISGIELSRQILLNLTQLSYQPIFEKELGMVKSIFVDNEVVYFGGDITYNNNGVSGRSVVQWNSTTNSSSLLPFGGFGSNSTVNSIIRMENNNLLFTGQFTKLENNSFVSKTNRTRNFSISMEDSEVGQQISLRQATWNANSNLDVDAFICPNSDQQAWYSEGSYGVITCNFPNTLTLSKIRIYNTPITDNQISLFRLIAIPGNGILNLTYLDPISHDIKHCTENCPLFTRETLLNAMGNVTQESDVIRFINNNSTNIKWNEYYQEFAFVNQLPITSLQFVASNSYYQNVGLSGFQIYQDSFPIFPNNSFNEPNCPSSNDIASYVKLSGNGWFTVANDNSYLANSYIPNQGTKPSITYFVGINVPGEYVLNLVTPGCDKDNTCSTRGIVNVTTFDNSNGNILGSALIYQNNNNLKYDQIFAGVLNNSISVQVEYYSGINTNTGTATVVVGVVDVVRVSISSEFISDQIDGDRSLHLNGIFEYSPSNFTFDNGYLTGKIDYTILDDFGVSNFNKGASIFAVDQNQNLYLGSTNGSVYELNSLNGSSVPSTENNLSGLINGMYSVEEGLVIFGSIAHRGREYGAVILNNSITPLDIVANDSIQASFNSTLFGSNLLVFDNSTIFNMTSFMVFENTSYRNLDLRNAGKNSNDDMLLVGNIVNKGSAIGNESLLISSNGTYSPFSLSDNDTIEGAIYLNDTKALYSLSSGNVNYFQLSDKQRLPWTWQSTVVPVFYSNGQQLLGAIQENSNKSQIVLIDLFSSQVINDTGNLTMHKINAIVNFASNATALVGGDFSLSNPACVGLCLYNYNNSNWSSFLNNSITGNISQIKFNDTQMLLSGKLEVNKTADINLLSINLTSNKQDILLYNNSVVLDDFILVRNLVVGWNSTDIFIRNVTQWSNLNIFDDGTNATINRIENFGSDSNPALIIYGQFDSMKYGTINAVIYDFNSWYPYFEVDVVSQTATPLFFADRDQSSYGNTRHVVPDHIIVSSSHSSSAPSSSSSHKTNKKPYKIRRGFVVLIGLALALATLIVLGITGVVIALLFNPSVNGDYDIIKTDDSDNFAGSNITPEKLIRVL